MNFKEYCEKEIYLHWKDDADFSSDFAEDFQTDYIPNLYYEMFEEQNKLFVLKNNPGIVLDSQHRDYIRKNYDEETFKSISKLLSACYQKDLKNDGKVRLEEMKKI